MNLVGLFRKILAARQDEIVKVLSWEVGKPLWESKQECGSLLALIDDSLKLHGLTTGEEKVPDAADE